MGNAYVENYIRAVIAAAKPKKMPGALANATGISLCSLNKPYATHNVQLILMVGSNRLCLDELGCS